ncbi:MAG: uroporphyrinogen-III synthase [Paludibacteraceae bacterium]|nr:uroporphyrinogen-III synthase [Paludibacteraceae bacterium]
MNDDRIKVIARSSQLSLLQVEEVFSLMGSLNYELIAHESYGDKHKEVSLMDAHIPADFFTRELDAAVLDGTADIAIHSAKDLPFPIPDGLEIYALTAASDKTDSLVSINNQTLAELPSGARIATSSAKRKQELLKIRGDLKIVTVRGTIEERIAQLDHHDFEALIVATCALHRLNLSHRIAEPLPFGTHPLQGHIAIVGRKGNQGLKDLFAHLPFHRQNGSSTQAFYLNGKEIPSIVSQLLDRGFDGESPVKLICQLNETTQKEYFFLLNELKHTLIHSSQPVLFLLGGSIKFPKDERKVLVTGTSTSWGEQRGRVTHTPLIRTEAIQINPSKIRGIDSFDYIVFTSRHGVKYFKELWGADLCIATIEKIKFVSVGEVTTHDLNQLGITPIYESETESAEGIIDYFKQNNIVGKKILLPRSAIGLTILPQELKAMGNEVVDLPIYNTLINTDHLLMDDFVDFNEILFSSPSGVAAFRFLYGSWPEEIPLTCKGKTTEKKIVDSL